MAKYYRNNYASQHAYGDRFIFPEGHYHVEISTVDDAAISKSSGDPMTVINLQILDDGTEHAQACLGKTYTHYLSRKFENMAEGSEEFINSENFFFSQCAAIDKALGITPVDGPDTEKWVGKTMKVFIKKRKENNQVTKFSPADASMVGTPTKGEELTDDDIPF